MKGRDFAIAVGVILVVGALLMFFLGDEARRQFRSIARGTDDVPDADLAPSEPTG